MNSMTTITAAMLEESRISDTWANALSFMGTAMLKASSLMRSMIQEQPMQTGLGSTNTMLRREDGSDLTLADLKNRMEGKVKNK